MKCVVKCKGFLLDESQGSFVNDRGETVDYHKARFYSSDDSSLFKVSIPDGAALPAPQKPVTLYLDVTVSERYCRATFGGYDA